MRPVLAALVLTMALPCAAQGATLQRLANSGNFKYVYTAGSEANDLVVERDGSGPIVFEDSVAIDSTGTGCQVVTPTQHVCTVTSINKIEVLLGGGNDNADTTEANWSYGFHFDGGDGNDKILAGNGVDVLNCGPGNNDWAAGGPRPDVWHACEVLDFSDHPSGVSVTPDDGLENDGSAFDSVNAGDSNRDKINPSPDATYIIGTEGHDTLRAAMGVTGAVSDLGGSDVVYGSDMFTDMHTGPGDDYYYGGTGNERFNDGHATAAESGDDYYSGGGGSDTISYHGRTCGARIWLDNSGGNGCTGEDDRLLNLTNVWGTNGPDDIRGNAAAWNQIRGYGGDDVIAGGPGKDHVNGGDGLDIASFADHSQQVIASLASPPAAGQGGIEDGSDGRDTFVEIEGLEGGGGADTLTGDDGPNVLRGGGNLDQLHGLDGADSFEGGGGQDVYHGGLGVDTADYSARTSPIVATLGGNGGESGENDNLQNSVDRLVGGSADDDLRGGATNSAQTLEGRGGNDVLDGGGGSDVMLGGAGTDRVSYATRNTGVVADLDGVADDGDAGIVENDLIGSDVEDLIGGGGGDILTGNGEPNRIEGGGGNDTLDGLGGVDRLGGGDGTDTITSRDDAADEVFCGSGGDSVIADALDVLAGDCESVELPAPASPAPPADGGTPAPAPPPTTGGSGTTVAPAILGVLLRGKPKYDKKRRLVLRGLCPSPATERCQGVLRIKLGSKTIATARFDVAGGARKTFRLKLSKATLRKLGRARRTKVTAAVIPTGGTAARKKLMLLRPGA